MMTRHFPWALRFLGCIVAASSAVSAALLWLAPHPSGLRVLDPQLLKPTVVLLLAVAGVVAPLAALVVKAIKYPLLKAAIFALAAFTNAMTLGPELVVPLQDFSSTLAVVCALALTVASLVVYMDRVQSRLASGT